MRSNSFANASAEETNTMNTTTIINPPLTAALLHLDLALTDPEIVAELRRHDETTRAEYAARALRIGVIALRQAQGAIDAETVKHQGERLISEVRELLIERTTQMTNKFDDTLGHYLDDDGTLALRLHELVKDGGELERAMSAYVEGESSALAATLNSKLGEKSALMKLLSPNQKGNLVEVLSATIDKTLAQQKKEILGQFSLDNKDSALTRLIGEMKAANGKLQGDLAAAVKGIVREFSLDHDESALARLRKEVMASVKPLAESNDRFQAEMRETIAAINGRREAEAKTTTRGTRFEDAVLEFLRSESNAIGDTCESVGTLPGPTGRKVGDHVIILGMESAVPGGRIVVEAKSRKNTTENSALEESAIARENRNASVGVFVLDRDFAPNLKTPIKRVGRDILVVWDAADPATDVCLRAAIGVARTLVIAAANDESGTDADIGEILKIVDNIGAHAADLQDILAAGRNVKKHNSVILSKAEEMHDALVQQVERLARHVVALNKPRT